MPDMLAICEHIVRRCGQGECLALCTLVHSRGSSPQELGAKLLLFPDGKSLGTLGGGCVEAEVVACGLERMATGAGEYLSFRLDHDYGWDDGLICGGTVGVYVQVLEGPTAAADFARIADALRNRQPVEFRIEFPGPEGIERYCEPIPPRPVLLIAGGGHVGQAVSRLATHLDFDVVVLDDRPEYTAAERFPAGTRCVLGKIDQELARQAIDEHTYIVIVTRGHKRDGRALQAVIESPARYLGLIGSRRKVATILADLAQRGVPAESLLRVHGPIGLELNAITVPEIAVSIAAELIAVRRGRQDQPATPMRLTPEALLRAVESKRTAQRDGPEGGVS